MMLPPRRLLAVGSAATLAMLGAAFAGLYPHSPAATSALRSGPHTPPAAALSGDFSAASVEGEAPQRRRRGYGGIVSSKNLPITNMPFDGKFTFLRLRFDEAEARGRGYEFGVDMGWNHDYPRAEYNLSMMLDELTTMPVTIDYRGGNIFSFTDPELYNYPFVYISEPGYWVPSDEEIQGLRDYLLKGGFVMVDDMEGDDTDAFYNIIQEALPGSDFHILDTTHPIFNCFFQITPEDILNQYYRAVYDTPVIFGVFEDNDPGKRLLAVVNHNQDIGESWEFSNTGYVPPEQANNSYKIGMNYIICSMLH